MYPPHSLESKRGQAMVAFKPPGAKLQEKASERPEAVLEGNVDSWLHIRGTVVESVSENIIGRRKRVYIMIMRAG